MDHLQQVDPQAEPVEDDAEPATPRDPRPPRSGAVARIAVAILSEPDVVLDDPPAIFGGASHTW